MGKSAIPLWVIAGLALGPAAVQGLARFAYALLLPAMRADLGWSYAEAGGANAANAAGYLLGALAARSVLRRLGAHRGFLLGMLATAVAVGCSGLTTAYPVLAALRLVAGAMGAVAFVAGGVLASAAAGEPRRAARVLGVYYAGGGFGIVLSALAIPPTLDAYDWRAGWLVLALMSLVCTALAAAAARVCPEPDAAQPGAASRDWSVRPMAVLLAAYALFGGGYIAYATFIIAFLRGELHFSSPGVSLFWVTLGLCSVGGAFVWSAALARLTGGRGAAATIAATALGTGLPLISDTPAAAFASAVVFGASFLSVVTAVSAFARTAYPPAFWAAAIGALTIAFGVGQSIGPLLGGLLSDGPSGVRAGLTLSVVVLACGAALALFQRERRAG